MITHTGRRLVLSVGFAVLSAAAIAAQQASTNVNVLPAYPLGSSSPPFPPPGVQVTQSDSLKGDGYLQRQVEPVVAASTYNPDHLVVAFGDFRTVDIATDTGVPGNGSEGWLGYSRSYDRGKHWYGAMVPGFPGGTSPVDLSSPLHGLDAGSDAVLANAPGGHFYLGGLFFTRGGISNVAVMHLRDVPELDGGDSLQAGKITIVDKGSQSDTGNFEDKPSIASDVSRNTTDSSVCGPVYMAYTIFTGGASVFTSKVGFSRSKQGKCGESWDNSQYLNKNYKQNQGTSIAIDPNSGKIYVVWRHIFVAGGDGFPNSILMATSTDSGNSFSPPVPITDPGFAPFDQISINTTIDPQHPAFRSNAFPAIAIDGGGNVYVAIQEKAGTSNYYEPRISIRTSRNGGKTWTAAGLIEAGPAIGGQQVMPSLTVGGNLLRAMWYDFRRWPRASDGVFGGFYITGLDRRMETRVAQSVLSADQTGNPAFTASAPVTNYLLDAKTGQIPTAEGIDSVNWSNVLLYSVGTTPFTGDYITLAGGSPFTSTVGTPSATSPFRWSMQPADYAALSSLAVWTDTRDVVFPLNGHWFDYVPPGSGGASCVNPGSRNQNVYFSEIKPGLIAGSPATSRQLVDDAVPAKPFERAFPFYVENPNPGKKFFRLRFQSDSAANPVAGSFVQGAALGPRSGSPVTSLDVAILGYSTLSKTLYVYCASCTSTKAFAPFTMTVNEITGIGAGEINGGLKTLVRFNNDPTAPFVKNTNLGSQEIHNASVSNPEYANPEYANPEYANQQYSNPEYANPEYANPEYANTAPVGDFVWSVTADGSNNSSAFSALVNVNPSARAGLKFELIVARSYNKPGAKNCLSQPIPQDQVISRIPLNFATPEYANPEYANPEYANPEYSNAAFAETPPATPGGAASSFSTASTKPGPVVLVSDSDGTAPIEPDKVFVILRAFGPSGTPPLTPTQQALILANTSLTVVPQAGDNIGGVITPPVPLSDKPFTTTVLTSNANPAAFAQPITFTAHVTRQDTNAPASDGTVEFREIDSQTGQTVQILAASSPVDPQTGNATVTVSSFSVGSHVVAAIFSGTAALNRSLSNALTEIVTKAPSTTTFGDAPTPAYPGGDFTVNASNNSGGAVTYSRVSGPCAFVSDATFSSTGVGTCKVQATSAETPNYFASAAQQDVIIHQATILIYGDSFTPEGTIDPVTGGTVSVNERSIAIANGYAVTVRTGEGWSALSQNDFKAFNAIVFPDPDCTAAGNDVPLTNAVATKTTWSPAVTGPMVLVGSDPVFHVTNGGGQAAAETLMANAINFAAKGTSTGMYFALSCYYHDKTADTAVAALDQFGTFTVQGADASNVHVLVPTHPVMAGLTDANLSGWENSVHEWFSGFPGGWQVLAAEVSGNNDPIPASRPYILAFIPSPVLIGSLDSPARATRAVEPPDDERK